MKNAENQTCSEKNNDRRKFPSQCVNTIDTTGGCIFCKKNMRFFPKKKRLIVQRPELFGPAGKRGRGGGSGQ